MDDDDWADWTALHLRLAAKADLDETPCHDCQAHYAAEMRAIGRCDGEPLATTPRESSPHVLASARSRRSRMLRRVERAASLRASGMTYAQIAREMGVTSGAVSKYLHMAREAA